MTNIKSTTCENISKCSEKSNNYIKSICEGECTYSCSDTAPLGITIIPGSGKFTEFPLSVDNLNNSDDATSFLDIIRNADICPRAFLHYHQLVYYKYCLPLVMIYLIFFLI